uniref:CARD domain-containing protein n=1 Tax=Phasianus colchicus TaxID=9054 RepID=A0A669QZA8_PHACC
GGAGRNAHALTEFKTELSKIQPKEGYECIELESVMDLSPAALASLLYSHFGQSHCVEVAAGVLWAMGWMALANDLLDKLNEGARFQHREQLIQRVTSVSTVLDRLYGHVLSNEQYQSIRAMPTVQEQMRLLYSFMPSWDVTCKDLFLDALKDTNSHLIQDLQGQ